MSAPPYEALQTRKVHCPQCQEVNKHKPQTTTHKDILTAPAPLSGHIINQSIQGRQAVKIRQGSRIKKVLAAKNKTQKAPSESCTSEHNRVGSSLPLRSQAAPTHCSMHRQQASCQTATKLPIRIKSGKTLRVAAPRTNPPTRTPQPSPSSPRTCRRKEEKQRLQNGWLISESAHITLRRPGW